MTHAFTHHPTKAQPVVGPRTNLTVVTIPIDLEAMWDVEQHDADAFMVDLIWPDVTLLDLRHAARGSGHDFRHEEVYLFADTPYDDVVDWVLQHPRVRAFIDQHPGFLR